MKPTTRILTLLAVSALPVACSGATTRGTPPSTAGIPVPVTGTPAPEATAGYVVTAGSVEITSPELVGSVTLAVGDRLTFRLAAVSGHRPGGGPVEVPVPVGEGRALQVVGTVRCPAAHTCAGFAAIATGSASVIVSGPSGVICGAGSACAGVSAAVRSIPVRVVAAGPPSVTAASAG